MAATLYDTLVSQGVTPGQTYNVQSQLYGKLGAPYGSYSGTAQQNTFILGKLSGSHYNDILGGSGASTQQPSGGGNQPAQQAGGGNSFGIPSYDTNPTDYYNQALALLQPSEQATIAPIQQMQANLPGIYQQKTSALQQDVGLTQATYAQQNKEIQDVQTQTANQIGAANMSAQGQQRAAAAARGMTETSGVEQSQEANIQAGANAQVSTLATNTANRLADLGLSESHDVNQLEQQIAALPSEQAQQALEYSSQIAQIQGQTWQQAISMGNQMLQTAADQAYKSFEVAMKEQDYQLAQMRLEETISHNQAMEQLSGLRVQLESQRVSNTQTNASITQQERAFTLQQKEAPQYIAQDARGGTTLKDLLNKYAGVMKPTDIWSIYQTSSKWGGTTEPAASLGSMGISVPSSYQPAKSASNSGNGFNLWNPGSWFQ